MKNKILLLYLVFCTSFNRTLQKTPEIISPGKSAENLFIIITDGFRWQEVFNGADSILLCNERYSPDNETIKSMYWAATKAERRKKLMPFFWNVIAKKGRLFGDRDSGSKVNVSNIYSLSYPGYNEIFTGTTDLTIAGNSKKLNNNLNVLEYLEDKNDFIGKVAVFSSWDVFPFILNKQRNGLLMNCGYDKMEFSEEESSFELIDKVQEQVKSEKSATRYDALTYNLAKEYITKNHPRIVVLGLGETDVFAHAKRYDLYLQQANQVDRMIAELWHLVQTTPGYKDNTNFIITTDHGRGTNVKHWSSHGFFINGSSQTWLGLLGPSINIVNPYKKKTQFYNKQFAGMIAKLVGEEFN